MIIGNPVRNYDEIEIAAPPAAVFDYVTRPDLWHEWHPASTSAELPRSPLQEGDAFHEIITVRYPLVRIRRGTSYTVAISKPHESWEVRGKSSLFDLTIHYDFRPTPQGTLFCRTLTYQVKGPLFYFQKIIVQPKIAAQSRKALQNLKAILEIARVFRSEDHR